MHESYVPGWTPNPAEPVCVKPYIGFSTGAKQYQKHARLVFATPRGEQDYVSFSDGAKTVILNTKANLENTTEEIKEL